MIAWHRTLSSKELPIVSGTVVAVGAAVARSSHSFFTLGAIVRVGIFAPVELVMLHRLAHRPNRQPVASPNFSKEIDATLGLEATGSDIAIASLRRMDVVEP